MAKAAAAVAKLIRSYYLAIREWMTDDYYYY